MAEMRTPSFDALRTWDGEQSRAFEELSFQLLKNRVPPGTRAIRTGNPDGGVEWYATLPDSTEWGWQAKHIKGIDALLTAMTDSVERVAKERPELRRLTFVISWNLATGTSGKERKSQRQKYEDKIRTWQNKIPGASKITFDLVQGSDLLDELVKPEHKGRCWFWWNQIVLGEDWLERRFNEQAAAAGQKYRPDLQVDVPIQEELLALGFDHSILSAFDRLRRQIVTAVTDLHVSADEEDETAASLYRGILDAAGALRSASAVLSLQAGDPPAVLDTLIREMSACSRSIDAAEEYEHRLAAEWRRLPADDPQKAKKPPERASSYGAPGLRSAIVELESWLDSPVGRSFRSRAYFLTGQAGAGKTHLLLDATRRALAAKRPAVFLAGARLGRSDLWGSIADQLGLQAVGADDLLRAMDSAGEASSTRGSRFLVFIDALNETTPAEFWRTHLPAFRAALAPYQHVALAVSCRDTYQDLVLEDAEAAHYVLRTHPGFADREVEATQRYFAHYGLEAPKIPLLTPEFTLPLFLRLYCESMSQIDAGPIPAGHQGRVAIFERYLDVKLAMVARRFQPDVSSSYELRAVKHQVKSVLEAILDDLSRLGRESVSAREAEEVARRSLNTPGAEAKIIGLLQEEGVLTRERLYLESGEYDEGVRIVFQAFADFLLLKRRLATSVDPPHDPVLKAWLANDCSWGIREAATILFPEAYSVELPDFLGISPPTEAQGNVDRAAWEQSNRARQTYRSLVETLPYRDSAAISQRTIDLLNQAQRFLSRDELYRVLFMLAPQPGNRLNGFGLHKYLLRYRMPYRDSDFGFATYNEISDPFTPVARLARWAAGGPYPKYDPEVIELACIPLCWLLSSPNRFMRDWVTKALVQLLRGHIDVMRALVQRFWTVDDPYVVQRVVVIAYGALLRSTPSQRDQAKGLAELVRTLVFTPPIRADELLLDAARGIVRWAVGNRLLLASALTVSKGPYGLKPPGPPPSEATLDKNYGWRKDQPDEGSYASIRLSLLSMGDFGRYVVESGLHHFSRYRIGQEYPDQERAKPRLIKSRWRKFVASLSADQQRKLADQLRAPDQLRLRRFSVVLGVEDDVLTDTQSALLDSVFVYPKPVDDAYPARDARRWVFRRTLSLGWTPELFGREDRRVGHGRGREEHKAERWGKKYQWMAYHELLARVADNYQPSRLHADTESYEGLHQIIGDREIDPSLPPIDFRAFHEHEGRDATAWDPPVIRLEEWPPVRLDFGRYRGDVTRFLADAESEPTVARSTFVRDIAGGDWVVLQSYTVQVDPLADKGWRGLQQRCAVHTVLVSSRDTRALLAALRHDSRRETRDLFDSNGHTDCCYVGEIGRIGPHCPYRHDKLRPATIGEESLRIVPTTEQYTWEGSLLDCSIGESATTILPSTFIQQTAGLSFDMRGPSWLDTTGVPVFTYYTEPGNGSHALLVRTSFLRTFLTTHKLELIALHWFHRMRLGDDDGRDRAFVESSIDARLTQNLKMREGQARRTERGQA